MNASQRSSQYVPKPGTKYSTPVTYDSNENSGHKQFGRSKTSSHKMNSSTNYKSGYSVNKPSEIKYGEDIKQQMGNELEESYHDELDEFSTPNSTQQNREINRMSYVSQLKSMKTKTSKFDDDQSEEVEDLLMKNGFHQSKGEFSLKNSSHQDCYFKNMNEFVDDKLDMVVEKLAEKKSLSTVNNTLR